MRHPEFPVVSFLCIVLLLCSLPSHVRAGAVSTLALIAWLGIMSFIRGINTIIWADNFVLRSEVWCDITTKLTIGFTYAVPACALCIFRHLESVSSSRRAITTKSDKRRRQIIEASMCFGIPIVGMALHYVVQGHRFDLFEDFGCAPTVYFSIPAVIIIWVPPMLMSLITFGYAAMAVRHFLRHRVEFAAHLHNSQSAITPTRYFRLMAMAIVEMVWDTGVNTYVIYFNTLGGLRPWISWNHVHKNFWRVQVFPEVIIPAQFKVQLIFQWWIIPVSCFCFFLFFGFGAEAMSDYRAAINWFRTVILRQNLEKPRGLLPLHRSRLQIVISQPTVSHTSSAPSFKCLDELSLKIPETVESLPHLDANRSIVPTESMSCILPNDPPDYLYAGFSSPNSFVESEGRSIMSGISLSSPSVQEGSSAPPPIGHESVAEIPPQSPGHTYNHDVDISSNPTDETLSVSPNREVAALSFYSSHRKSTSSNSQGSPDTDQVFDDISFLPQIPPHTFRSKVFH